MIDRDDAVTVTAPADSLADAGKADPSRNAVTHGLTARRPLCEQEADRLRVLVDRWTAKHMPETDMEEALVQSSAVEYVRYLRCVQADEKQLAPAVRDALAEWREKRRHAIRRKAQDLREDPGRVAAELHESAFGIDWMLRHWKELRDAVSDARRGWLADDVALVLALLGLPARFPSEQDADARRLYIDAAAACPAAFDRRAPAGVADPDAADRLRAFVDERIARLEALRPLVWDEVEAPQAEAVEASAMLDTSKEGQLRQRYRREALRDMQKGMSLLIRLKVERSKIDGRQLHQERLARSLSADARDDRPAYVPPSSSSSRPTDPDPSPQRNEPPATAPAEAADRHNPNSRTNIQPGSSASSPADAGRTATRPEAHRPRTDAPEPGPNRPDRAPEGPRSPDRSPDPRA